MIRDGWRAYLAVDGETARARLTEALRSAVELAPWPSQVTRVADVALRLGVVDAHLGDTAAAEAHVRLALQLDPARQIDATEFSPDIVAMVESMRSPIAPVAIAFTPPTDAPLEFELEVDGAVGDRDELAPGLHLVVLRGPDVQARAALVDVPATGGAVAIEVVVRPGVEALADAPTPGDAPSTVRAFILALAERDVADEVMLLATAQRPRGVAWLGQRCDRTARCTEVIELSGPSDSDDALATALWRELSAAPLIGEPSLTTDSRLADEAALPTPTRRWYRKPWVWATAGAVVLAGVATSLLLLDGDTPAPVVAIDPSQF